MTADRSGRGVAALSARLGPVLPAAAVPLLRAAAVPYADDDLPAWLAGALGTEPVGDADHGLLCTLDPSTGAAARWLAAGAPLLDIAEPRGAALLDAVAVMDRLRSPGGCPWDAEQTHTSLLPYLIEEAYELYQAVEDGDRAALGEELGDVLLQVLFHARLAAETPADGIDADSVAEALVDKLVRRHPHVFTGAEAVHTAAAQQVRWEQLKHAEKQRGSCLDGVALAQPAAALAAKIVSRAARAGVPPDLLSRRQDSAARLLNPVTEACLSGGDPEGELRAAARCLAADIRAGERAAAAAGRDPAALTERQWRAHWPER